MAQNKLVAIEICLAEGKPEARGADPGGSPAGKDHLDSLAEAPGRQERTNWTAWEAPGRQERTNWTACEAPGRQERHWELFAFKPCPFPKWGLGL